MQTDAKTKPKLPKQNFENKIQAQMQITTAKGGNAAKMPTKYAQKRDKGNKKPSGNSARCFPFDTIDILSICADT